MLQSSISTEINRHPIYLAINLGNSKSTHRLRHHHILIISHRVINVLSNEDLLIQFSFYVIFLILNSLNGISEQIVN